MLSKDVTFKSQTNYACKKPLGFLQCTHLQHCHMQLLKDLHIRSACNTCPCKTISSECAQWRSHWRHITSTTSNHQKHQLVEISTCHSGIGYLWSEALQSNQGCQFPVHCQFHALGLYGLLCTCHCYASSFAYICHIMEHHCASNLEDVAGLCTLGLLDSERCMQEAIS